MLYANPSRRSLLKMLGGGSILLPLLESRFAGAASSPRRLVVLATPNGTVQDSFWPVGSGTDLKSLAFPAITKPLERHRDDLLFVVGIEYQNFRGTRSATDYVNSHFSFPSALTGHIGVRGTNELNKGSDGGLILAAGCKSIDQFIADEAQKTANLKFPLLNVGVQSNGSGEKPLFQLSFSGPDKPNPVEDNPFRLADRLFADLGMSQTDLARQRAEKKSILDYVGRSAEQFAPRLGTVNRDKISQHLASVRRLEESLLAVSGVCTKPMSGPMINVALNSNMPALLNANLDAITAAMSCDLTRVATIQFNHGGGDFALPWLGNDFTMGAALAGNTSITRGDHDLAHGEGNNAEAKRLKIIVETWFATQFAALIDRFKAVKEGSGTMLDNTIILWINNMGTGYDHGSKNIPWLMAGGRSLGIQTGKYLEFGEFAAKGDRGKTIPQNGALVAIVNALTDANVTFYGDQRYGGELAGIRK